MNTNNDGKWYLVSSTGFNVTAHTASPNFNSKESALAYKEKFKHAQAVKSASVVFGKSNASGVVTPLRVNESLSESFDEGDQVVVVGDVFGNGKAGTIKMVAPSGYFSVVKFSDGTERSYQNSDLRIYDEDEDSIEESSKSNKWVKTHDAYKENDMNEGKTYKRGRDEDGDVARKKKEDEQRRDQRRARDDLGEGKTFKRNRDEDADSKKKEDEQRRQGRQQKHQEVSESSGAGVAYDVFLDGEQIDTVFFGKNYTEEEVKKSLVDHDGMDPAITVKAQSVEEGKTYKRGRDDDDADSKKKEDEQRRQQRKEKGVFESEEGKHIFIFSGESRFMSVKASGVFFSNGAHVVDVNDDGSGITEVTVECDDDTARIVGRRLEDMARGDEYGGYINASVNEGRKPKEPEGDDAMSMHDIKSAIANAKASLGNKNAFDPEYRRLRSELSHFEELLKKTAPYGRSLATESIMAEAAMEAGYYLLSASGEMVDGPFESAEQAAERKSYPDEVVSHFDGNAWLDEPVTEDEMEDDCECFEESAARLKHLAGLK